MNKLLTRTIGSQPGTNHIAFVDFSRRARTWSVYAGDASSEMRRSEARRGEARRGEARRSKRDTTTSFLRDG